MRPRSLAGSVVLLVSACAAPAGGSPSGASSPATGGAAAVISSSVVPPSPSPAASPAVEAPTSSPVPPSAAGETLCTPSGSTLTVADGEGAMEHFSLLVHVRNAAHQPCRTTGYPGVALLDGTGRQIEQAQRTPDGFLGGVRGVPPPRIVLAPGEEATAMIEGRNVNPDGTSCPVTSPALLVTLPDNTDSTRFTHQVLVCPGLLVHPLVPGHTGELGVR